MPSIQVSAPGDEGQEASADKKGKTLSPSIAQDLRVLQRRTSDQEKEIPMRSDKDLELREQDTANAAPNNDPLAESASKTNTLTKQLNEATPENSDASEDGNSGSAQDNAITTGAIIQ